MINSNVMKSGGAYGRIFRVFSFVFSMIIAVSSCITVYGYSEKISVTVIDGDESRTVYTDSREPRIIAAEAGFITDYNDEFNIDDFSEENGGTIVIRRAKLVRIDNDGVIEYVLGYDDTVGEILVGNGISIQSEESVSESLTKDIFDGMIIFIKRVISVKITCGSEETTVCVSGGTVAEAVEKAGIELGEDDIVVPDKDTSVLGVNNIIVKHVTTKYVTKTEVCKYGTDTVKDPDMYVGTSKTVKAGTNGEKEVTYCERYIDGEYADSTAVSEKITKEPVNAEVRVGTKKAATIASYRNSGVAMSPLEIPSDITFDENGIPTNYSQCITGNATAYTGGGTCATGVPAQVGYVAVNPKQIPYGSKLYIVSADGSFIYGYAIAADTGGFASKGKTTVDLYMDTVSLCYEWGNGTVNIYVL